MTEEINRNLDKIASVMTRIEKTTEAVIIKNNIIDNCYAFLNRLGLDELDIGAIYQGLDDVSSEIIISNLRQDILAPYTDDHETLSNENYNFAKHLENDDYTEDDIISIARGKEVDKGGK